MKSLPKTLLLLTLWSPLHLGAHAAIYVAPLCIGISFAGAFSWSVFRRPTRTEITRTEINPIVIHLTSKHDTKESSYIPLEKVIKKYKKKETLQTCVTRIKDQQAILSRTIPSEQNDPLWIITPGYKGKRPKKIQKGDISLDSSLNEAATLVEAAHIPSPCVTFEFDDSRRSFNFAQKGDIKRLSLIYEELAPSHNLVLFGSCRGGTTVLNLLSNPTTPYKNSIKALILESPALSLQKLAERVGETHLAWLPHSGSMIHTFFRTWFPSYNAHFPSCLSNLINIPHDLPILIGHVENDKVIAWSDIQDLVTGLVKTGHKHVYLARINDPSISHARLNSNENFKNILNAFLATYNLPHDKEKARSGVKLLEKARLEALLIAQKTLKVHLKNSNHSIKIPEWLIAPFEDYFLKNHIS